LKIKIFIKREIILFMDTIRVGDYQFLIISWKDIIKLVDKLSEKIISSYEPNTIIGVLRWVVSSSVFGVSILDSNDLDA
jgi:hypothetical protein